jgi:hypothetical protein
MKNYFKVTKEYEKHIGYIYNYKLGWAGLLLPLLQDLRTYNSGKKESERIEITIGSKFGGLDIRGNFFQDEYIRELVIKALTESHHTCEHCGAVTTAHQTYIDYWYRTLCNECEEQLLHLPADERF